MDTDLSTSLLTARLSQTQLSAQVAIVKKNHEMDMALLQMIDDVARSAPPAAGTGRLVDKTA